MEECKFVYNQQAKYVECENNVQMVNDLTNVIIGFNDDEINDILDYVTTI